MLFLGNSATHFLAALVVLGLLRGRSDTRNRTSGVASTLLFDTNGDGNPHPPDPGISLSHLYGYGSMISHPFYNGLLWEGTRAGQTESSYHTARGDALSDGRNTTCVLSLPLLGTNPEVSSLRISPGTSATIPLSVYLGFDGSGLPM